MLLFRWITYYPAVEEANELMRVLRDYGLYRDEHKDFCEEMQRLRVLRGKAKERYGPVTPNSYLLKALLSRLQLVLVDIFSCGTAPKPVSILVLRHVTSCTDQDHVT